VRELGGMLDVTVTVTVTVSVTGDAGVCLRTLSGLADVADRIRTVDGRFEVRSPVGGPDAVRVRLPMSV
jgi:hypothetical protein